jgi:hypothetical protein
VFCIKSLNNFMFSSDETQLIMSVAMLLGVIRSVLSPGTFWLSSLVSLRLRLRCRGVVSSMYSLFFFLCRYPFGRRDVQANPSGKRYCFSLLWPSFMDGFVVILLPCLHLYQMRPRRPVNQLHRHLSCAPAPSVLPYVLCLHIGSFLLVVHCMVSNNCIPQ